MENDEHYQIRLEEALFGNASPHSPRSLEQIAIQAEALRDAHDTMLSAIQSADDFALPPLTPSPR
ncbi:hypothetical protein [Thioclava kandeliae]|uniref:Uncharacterized protein n=1 Tax=Thioclava kandeliae TaxID=3070818 RepID=A0ABV1SFG6_9RHOB